MEIEMINAVNLTLYTSKEAAAILRVRQSWLERQAAGRKMPFAMLGGSYRFTSDHLAQIVGIFETAPIAGARSVAPIPRQRRRHSTDQNDPGQSAPLIARPRRQQVA